MWPFLLAPFKKTLGVDEFDPVAGLAQRRGDDDMLALSETSADYIKSPILKLKLKLNPQPYPLIIFKPSNKNNSFSLIII